MEHQNGWIVRSTAGHDKDTLYCVVGLDDQNDRLLLANGKRRKAAAPKAKQPRHVEVLDRGGFSNPTIGRLKQGVPVTDRELRAALAVFKEGNTLG